MEQIPGVCERSPSNKNLKLLTQIGSDQVPDNRNSLSHERKDPNHNLLDIRNLPIEGSTVVSEEIRQFFHDQCIEMDDPFRSNPEILKDFLNLGPLHYFIPPNFGGKMFTTASYLHLLETTSYFSVPLGLTLGITGTLFIRPMARFASHELRRQVTKQFLIEPQLGGLMITEPTAGTDIFSLQTSYSRIGKGLAVKGTKSWAGLTGQAQHWLIAARETRNGTFSKRINLIYVPSCSGITVQRYFDALGLLPIFYGESNIHTCVPNENLLEEKTFGSLRIIYDTIFRSRMGIPAIAAGLCKRLSFETQRRVSKRKVFKKALSGYDQIQFRCNALKGGYEICHSIWRFSAQWMDSHIDVSRDTTFVNACKTISSETMHASSDSALQIFAASGYQKTHYIGQAFLNSRPFRIFEGTNDVLYQNIIDAMVKPHQNLNENILEKELLKFGLSLDEKFPLAWLGEYEVSRSLSQRMKVHAGKLIAWAFILGILRDRTCRDSLALDDAWGLALREIHALAAMTSFIH